MRQLGAKQPSSLSRYPPPSLRIITFFSQSVCVILITEKIESSPQQHRRLARQGMENQEKSSLTLCWIGTVAAAFAFLVQFCVLPSFGACSCRPI